MSIRCIAIDDEPMALEKIKSYIQKISYLELVAACDSPADAIQIMSDTAVDAVFVDINMPDMNGLDFVKVLPEMPLVVFKTAYSEYAVESYRVRAVDYLLKPYTFEEFQRAADYVQQQWLAKQKAPVAPADSDNVFLKVDYRYIRVSLKDIVFIEGMNEYLKIHLVSGDPYLVHTSFKQINNHLPENFLQVHRSYVVNVNHICEVERSVIFLKGGKWISVSDSNKDMFMAYLKNRSLSR